MTLTEFLLVRIAEDQAVAQKVPGDGEFCTWNRSWDMSPTRDLVVNGERVAPLPMTMDEHICRWAPARVLAECEAKRRIVKRLAPIFEERQFSYDLAEYVLCDLATVYAAHPDYREEWKP